MQRNMNAIEKSFTLPGLKGERAHARAAARAIHAAIETIEADGGEVTDYKAEFCNNAWGEVTAAIETIYFTREGKDYFCLGMANYLNGHAKPLI
jgi:hypothetical protein